MKRVDIGVLSKTSGVSTSTLRYYEELGLIQSVGRHGLRRQYSEDTFLQLAVIALGKTAGFSLDEIRGLFDADRHLDLPRADLLQRADALEHQIRRMTSLSKLLRHVAQCPAPSHLGCPRFRKLLRAAGHSAPLEDAIGRAADGDPR